MPTNTIRLHKMKKNIILSGIVVMSVIVSALFASQDNNTDFIEIKLTDLGLEVSGQKVQKEVILPKNLDETPLTKRVEPDIKE